VQQILGAYSQRARENSPEGARQVRLFAAIALAALPPDSDD